ncbi:hypothetical protein B0H10DRAFT_1956480 [Mycena sp. CBHHK59/15]|nr:hypothetical protein B0H10DRAFT_1956480 [Mycena sp. CBHHK59/15]
MIVSTCGPGLGWPKGPWQTRTGDYPLVGCVDGSDKIWIWTTKLSGKFGQMEGTMQNGQWKRSDNDAILDEFDGNFSSEEPDLDAIRAYRNKELSGGRWSPPIEKLVPGMKISPLFVVWQQSKEDRLKPRIITDQTASGLNSGIPREDAKVRYDDMRSFGLAMREARCLRLNTSLVLFKDDITGAFPTLPAHPIWQLRQVVQVDGSLHIVRRLCFGGCSSPRIWCSLSALVCWIAVRKLDIRGLHVYMDDFFGWDVADNLVFLHGKLRPRKQVQLLLLWDRLGVPYGDLKQDHGAMLKIIGFWPDINRGTISLTPDSITDLSGRISSFLNHNERKPPLRNWQQLTGHLNWSLNVLPWARPALSELYRKMEGKTHPRAGIFLNAEVIQCLTWFQDALATAIGIAFINDDHWDDQDADMVAWTDASLKMGIAFVYANKGFFYGIQMADPTVKIDIFFLEMIGILSAVHHAACLPKPPKRLLIWSDSMDSVDILNLLKASEPLHNGVLLAIAVIIIKTTPERPHTGAMEAVLLDVLGGPSRSRSAHPIVPVQDIDDRAHFLQTHAIERSTVAGYTTGARDYVRFCINHNLPLDPTISTLSRYIAYTSKFIASGPKYLTGARHFLKDIYPEFDANRSSALVQSTITGSKKIRADPVKRKLLLRIAHLAAFYQLYVTNPTYDMLLFITILSCMFYGCHRSGELVQKSSKNLLDYRKIIKRASLKFENGHVEYRLPYHKSDRFY